MGKTVKLDVIDGVARILLDAPDNGNAIGPSFTEDFAEVVEQVAALDDLRVVLLSNAGEIFSVGGDIKDFIAKADTFADGVGDSLDFLNASMHKLATLPVPVICAVNGPVGGGGIALALCGDIVIATETAKLRGGYTAIGLSPDLGASFFLVRRAGLARAKRIFLLNEPISAATCLEWGVFDEVLPADQFNDRVESLVNSLRSGATSAIGRTKKLLDDAWKSTLDEQLEAERNAMIESAGSSESREGIAAFIEKRMPEFK